MRRDIGVLAALVLAALVRCDSATPGSSTAPPERPGAAAAQAVIQESRDLLKVGKLRKAQDRLKTVLGELQAQQASVEALADVYGQLGIVYSHSSKETEAIAAFENAADLMARQFKPSDARVGVATNRLADALVQAGAHVRAVPLYQRLLTAMREGLGISHPGYRSTLGKLADAAAAAGKPKVAIKALRETLDVLRQEPAGGNPQQQAAEVGKARVKLARALGGTGAFEEALEHASGARELHETGAVTAG
jgi:tetratricopeptide (TPR) repeat protein